MFPANFHLSDSAITNRSVTHLWAPDVHFINGTYCLYYGVFDNSTGNGVGFDIALATSTTMDDGSWVDRGSIGLPEDHKHYSSLGANLLLPNNSPSPPHRAWGSHGTGMYGIDMATTPFTVLSSEKVAQELVADNEWPASPLLNEGPFQYHFGGYVYLFYSRGNCCPGPSDTIDDVYGVEICRSQNAKGPYVDRSGASCLGNTNFGTTVLASNPEGSVWAPGSVGVLDDVTEGQMLYYQYHVKGSNDVRFVFNFLEFDGEGWPVLVADRNGTATATVSGTGGGSASATATKKSEEVMMRKSVCAEVLLVVLVILIQRVL
jgi:arabinan endo-1,5-alpha-L-arabinosidase